MAETKTETKTEVSADGVIAFDSLKESHGSQARAVFNEITNAMGLGSFSPDFIRGDGTVDLPDIDATHADKETKARISEILKRGKK